MVEGDIETVLFAGAIVLIWTGTSIVMELLLPIMLSQIVSAGISGGIAFVLSVLFIDRRYGV
ncbi:hypothetical protein C440_09923 [Haloferax mucosum ATCC BAA-1512]|uniref:Uncharacterized protein n=1 Tax=Haloferax mucosum ATCC BAA-1512 TaxID=662479 RepID=M0IEK8_9EURY|nr:hypothetical protein [Haloferax mucosum]ELZ94487.1 hypothetical protein C440_09923 [Haloferax mucosum ATCC BAA-1512]